MLDQLTDQPRSAETGAPVEQWSWEFYGFPDLAGTPAGAERRPWWRRAVTPGRRSAR